MKLTTILKEIQISNLNTKYNFFKDNKLDQNLIKTILLRFFPKHENDINEYITFLNDEDIHFEDVHKWFENLSILELKQLFEEYLENE